MNITANMSAVPSDGIDGAFISGRGFFKLTCRSHKYKQIKLTEKAIL